MNGTAQEMEFNHGCIPDLSLKPLYPLAYITQQHVFAQLYMCSLPPTSITIVVKVAVYESLGKKPSPPHCDPLFCLVLGVSLTKSIV